MAEDEIERLLREIDATSAGRPAATPAPTSKPSSDVAKPSSGGGRVAFAVLSGGVMGIGAFVFAVFTPWTDAWDMGFAAAGAAFLTGLVAGPPKWFSS